MGAFVCLSQCSYNTIKELRQKGIIENDFYINVSECDDINDIMIVMKNYFNIRRDDINLVWEHIRNKRWEWVRGKKNECFVFNQYQSVFIDKLLKNGGIYLRENCQKEILTDQQIINQIGVLEDEEIIFSLRTRRNYSNRTLFFLNPKILLESRNET